ncbi:alpha/beta fold hydrolase [Desmospora profundinema]|uniref:3-oxoadipate enol-lactonase n=1 Tax=Desmospora profundinema TaxID=1571184 RepID=A0ABU1IK63_9BACL|nr:alpha/beta fold hydrolase [Desmospora profundinema]MDR6225161.1 3-oxoadipate enol-lactonase [Desmospora profundinema]
MRFFIYRGGRIAYRLTGEGPPLLLLHGMGANHRLFEPQIPEFSSRFHLILPDMRGHGRSSPLPIDFTYELLAEDMKALLDHLEIPTCDILGISMGAIVAQALALAHGDRIRRLVLADGYCQPPSRFAGFCYNFSTLVFRILPIRWIKQLLTIPFRGSRPGYARTRHLLQRCLTDDRAALLRLKEKPPPDFTRLLHRIQSPTLVMAGDRLKWELQSSRIIAQNLPDARFAVFHGGCDPLNAMRTAPFNTLVTAFLDEKPLPSLPGVTFLH